MVDSMGSRHCRRVLFLVLCAAKKAAEMMTQTEVVHAAARQGGSETKSGIHCHDHAMRTERRIGEEDRQRIQLFLLSERTTPRVCWHSARVAGS